MAIKTNNKVIIPGTGTDQQQRLIEALNPESLKLQDFSVADWMKFAWHFAEKENYFNSSNQKDGNWQDFFIEESKIKTFLDSLDSDNSLNPHLTLFVCFLKLLDISREHFNRLTKRHLDFYFQTILKIEKQPLTPEKVHVLFELAKNSLPGKIDKNTSFDAGKDSKGNKLVFKTQEEIIVNKAVISQLKNIYYHSDGKLNTIKACEIANSFDGNGKVFPTDDSKWYPFGYVKSEYTQALPELPDARLGFAVSSPVLLLKEGIRTITLNLVFQNSFSVRSLKQIEQHIKVYLSGEKKWLELPKVEITPADENDSKSMEYLKKREVEEVNALDFKVFLDKTIAPVANYNSELLGERFTGTNPVMRFIVDTQSAQGFSFAKSFSRNKLTSITLSVDVKEMKGIEIENDFGVLNPKKPFFPFGPIPLRGSKFMLKTNELFQKNWEELIVNIKWLNKPDSLKDQYFAYRKEFLKELTTYGYKKSVTHDPEVKVKKGGDTTKLIVDDDSYFKASVEIFSEKEWTSEANDMKLFNKEGINSASKAVILNKDFKFDTSDQGQLRLSLQQSLLHEMYPRIYALAMMNDKTTLIPKEPYTPIIELIEIGYSASAKVTFDETTKQKYTGQTIQLFHEHPFGQCEKQASSAESSVCLIPEYQSGGELYIGLKDAEPLQQISLLFQIFEGSENPDAVGFSEGEKIEWSALCSNNWMPLTGNYLISNNTDNFLKSGIVKFSIPAEATKNNTLLAPNLIWIRAKMNQKFDVVCKIINIKAQAVLAQFDDKGNELSHLTTGIQANMISKLTESIQAIKTVSQPFNSFDGSSAETDKAYYQRISERLRHKNRAITLWDYEHLILQQFPEIHKVRCLNHTSETSFLSPGNITLVVIPDILNKNVFDIYQPRVSRTTLNKIKSYINELNTQHVNADIINPEYEEVEILLEAKFLPGYDENYYLKILQEDLTKLLSPWAFEKTADLQFGTVLHQSVIISYIEKLQYVDYITNLNIRHMGEKKPSVTPSNPKAILVSAKVHPIIIHQPGCKK